MPTYVYKFIETGETVEVQQSFSDATLTEYTHPATGATMPVKKVFLPVGVTFKGDGFYKTDSRSSGKKSSAEAGSSANGDGSSKAAGSSDASSSTSSSEPKPKSDPKPKSESSTASSSSTSSSSGSSGD
jgi:predicted nucleic acid-binding Zn ribbon protein